MKKNILEITEMQKLKVHIMVEIVEYSPHTVLSKTIIKKTTGNITVSSFDKGEELAIKIFPFDNYILIINGAAENIISRPSKSRFFDFGHKDPVSIYKHIINK